MTLQDIPPRRLPPLACVLAATLIAAAHLPGSAQDDLAAPASPACTAGRDAYLRGELHGALAGPLDWAGAGLECAGGLRPGGEGIRLQFAGPLQGGGRAVLILGIDTPPGPPEEGEWPLNLTLIEEGAGRFYATQGPGRCWARLTVVSALPEPPGGYSLAGSFWCAGALPSLRDRTAVTPGEIRFAARVAAASEGGP